MKKRVLSVFLAAVCAASLTACGGGSSSSEEGSSDSSTQESAAIESREDLEGKKIGVQQGTTGNSYVEGSEDLGFPGLQATCQTYKSGSLAVQDMLNGNIDYVIIDAAPEEAITKAINEMQ